MLALAWQVRGGPSQLISTLDPGQAPPAGGSSDSVAPIISPDGRYVLFASFANNLMLNTNSAPIPALAPSRLNVYLRDRTNLTTTLVSVNLSGLAGGNGDSLPTGLSPNGQYVLFESSASDLVPGDTNNAADVFIRDLVAGTTTLVSASTNGVPGNLGSRGSVMTPDGGYVAFVSDASNLMPGDTNGIADVFVRDMQAGVTTLVTVGATAYTGSGAARSSECPDITPDGRYVAFYSTATNLVPGVTNSDAIYMRDLVGGTTTWASTYALAGVRLVKASTASTVCYNHVLSTNGQFVAYQASPSPLSGPASVGVILRYDMVSGLTDVVSTNATAGTGLPQDLRGVDMTPDGRYIAFLANTNSTSSCVYVWDAQTRVTRLASGNPNLLNQVPPYSICDWPTLSPDARFVLFVNNSNLVSSTAKGDIHVYMRDMQAGTTAMVDVDTNGIGAAFGQPSAPQMSADGRFVVFECPDAGLAANDRNRAFDVFVRDLATHTTELISARDATLPSATANGPSLLSACSVSRDGSSVAFASEADNLVPGDTNGWRDIFVCNLFFGTNALVSVATNGRGADGMSLEPAISADGRYVAFTSSADNLVGRDTNKASDVFVRDLLAGTTALVSVTGTGAGSGNSASYSPAISADGRYVLFRSLAGNLTATYLTSGYENLFVRDLQRGTNYLLRQTSSGSPLGAMTPDGRFVAFYGSIPGYTPRLYVWKAASGRLVYTNALSGLTNLGISPGGTRIAYTTTTTLSALDWVSGTNWTISPFSPAAYGGAHPGLRFSADGRFLVYTVRDMGTNQVYLYDLQYRTNCLVSHAYGSPWLVAYGASDWPEISSDGRFVAYRSAALNILPGATNGVPGVFLYDRPNNTTTLLSTNLLGGVGGNNRSLAPVFSADGQMLVFASWASDLVAQDFNQGSDLLACRLYASGPIPLCYVEMLPAIGLAQRPWLTWPIVAGKTYVVQFKNTPQDADWQTLSGGVTILGNQGCLNDLSTGAGPRFYRVVAY
jgi:Tol biopolymer transport system component